MAPQLISCIAKLELKLERQNKYAFNYQKNAEPEPFYS